MGELYADVGIPVPLGQSFTYRVTAALADRLRPGTRVVCEFGQRKVLGIVLGTTREPPAFDLDKLKPIAALLDPEPALSGELLGFVRELAAYYFAPIGEVLRLALPAVERERVRALQAQGSLLPGEVPDRTRQVGGRLVHLQAADDVDEHVLFTQLQAQALGQHRRQQQQPVEVHAVGRAPRVAEGRRAGERL